jgi:quercetin dioxygenase-like cupin family protein
MARPYTLLDDLADQITDIQQDSIVSKTLVDNPAVKAVLFGFAPGQALSEHHVPQHAILHFLEGEAEVVLGGDRTTAKAGTWAHMPPDLAHSIHARTPVKMLLLMLKK